MNYTIRKVTNQSDLDKAFGVRRQVFIIEQQVPESIELDQFDPNPNTYHLIALDSQGIAVGAARFRPYSEGIAKVERVAVLAHTRGTGLGKQIMEFIEESARNQGFHTCKLHAQLQARGFYEKLGYDSEGEIFLDANIEHITMKKTLR